MIVPPYSRSHSQTISTKRSRPTSSRERALRDEVLLDRVLGRDAGVVVAGQEERLEAAHPVPADEQVGERDLQRVTGVQRAGDVRRRVGDDERRAARAGLGVVEALVLPGALPALFDALRLVQRLHEASLRRRARVLSRRIGLWERAGFGQLDGAGGRARLAPGEAPPAHGRLPQHRPRRLSRRERPLGAGRGRLHRRRRRELDRARARGRSRQALPAQAPDSERRLLDPRLDPCRGDGARLRSRDRVLPLGARDRRRAEHPRAAPSTGAGCSRTGRRPRSSSRC